MPDMPEAWETIASFVEQQDAEGLTQLLDGLTPGDIGRAVSRLDDDRRTQLFTLLDPEYAAEIIDALPDAQGADVLEEMHAEDAAKIIGALETDEQADLLAEMDVPEAQAVLNEMAPKDAATARSLMAYEPDTAGGLMTAQVLKYEEHMTVADVLDDLRDHVAEYSDYGVQYVYVVDDRDRLTGVVRLRDLILSKPSTPLTSFMIREPTCLPVDTSLAGLEHFFDRNSFIGVPIVDADGVLVGVVDRSDVEEAHGDRADQTYLRSSGIVGGEEFRSMPLSTRASRRLSWLTVAILLSIMSASVIALFQETLQAWIALAVFLPIISNMSGCSGNQSVAVSIRELALGIIEPRDYMLIVRKEVFMGIATGVSLGAMLGAVGLVYSLYFEGSERGMYLGLVVGSALAISNVVAVCMGGVIPLLMRRLHIDPALASGPMVTTISDMCGFFVTLSLATLILRTVSG